MELELIAKCISSGLLLLAIIGFFVQMCLDSRTPNKEPHVKEYKSRLPKYYCPHCQKFRKRWQIHVDDGIFFWSATCRYCDHEVEETEELFRSWLVDHFENEDKEKEESERARREQESRDAVDAILRTGDVVDALSRTGGNSNLDDLIKKANEVIDKSYSVNNSDRPLKSEQSNSGSSRFQRYAQSDGTVYVSPDVDSVFKHNLSPFHDDIMDALTSLTDCDEGLQVR